MAQRGSEGMGNRMNRAPGSGKVLNGSEGVKGGGESNEQRPRIWNGSEWPRGGQRRWSFKCHRLKHYIADRYKVGKSGGARGGQRGLGIEWTEAQVLERF